MVAKKGGRKGLLISFGRKDVYFVPTDDPKATIKRLQRLLLDQRFITAANKLKPDETFQLGSEAVYELLNRVVTIRPFER